MGATMIDLDYSKKQFDIIYSFYEQYKNSEHSSFNVFLRKMAFKEKKPVEYYMYWHKKYCYLTTNENKFNFLVNQALETKHSNVAQYAKKNGIAQSTLLLARQFVCFIQRCYEEIKKENKHDIFTPFLQNKLPQILDSENMVYICKRTNKSNDTKQLPNITFNSVDVKEDNVISDSQDAHADAKPIISSQTKNYEYIENYAMQIKSPKGLSISIPSSYPEETYQKLMTYLRSL